MSALVLLWFVGCFCVPNDNSCFADRGVQKRTEYFKILLLFVCVRVVCLHEHLVHHVHAVPTKAKRGHQIELEFHAVVGSYLGPGN